MEFFDNFLNLIQDPLFSYVLLACNILSLVCWIASLLTDNFSQVDRLWSILPAAYALTFSALAIHYNPETNNAASSILGSDLNSQIRLFIMTFFITVWGSRLTYNFWRKGGYNPHDEDYRWVHVRKMFNYPEKKLMFHIFNFTFVAFIQNWLLLGLATPIWFIATNKPHSNAKAQEEFNFFDLIVTLMFLTAFVIEVLADQQQFKFQTRKYKWLSEVKNKKSVDAEYSDEEVADFKRGFLTRGLFKFSRHPNFFGEMSIWWCIYLFTISSQYPSICSDFQWEKLVNYCILAPITLSLIFHSSTELTEKISAGKYPEYKKYQQRVSRILPWLPGDLNKSD